jgi:NADH-quinone oxidoreductase subunit G
MDVCPVGAITTRDYRFKSRPWDNPDAVDTICTLCSKGCSTTLWLRAKPEWAKGAQLVRITPRLNPDVNDYWMCDIGRFDYHWIESEDRLHKPLKRTDAGLHEPVTWEAALSAVAARVTDGLTVLTSAHASNEELFLIQRVASQIALSWRYREKPQPATTRFRVPPADAPNINGARDLGLPTGAGNAGAPAISALRTEIEEGRVSTLYVFDPGPQGSLGDVGWVAAARQAGKLKFLVYHGVLMGELARAADVVLPGAAWVEKDATYTNDQGRVQAASRAFPPPANAMDDCEVFLRLATTLGQPLSLSTVADVRAALAETLGANPAYASLGTMSFARPVAAANWLQASTPSERWKWDYLFQDLPPVKFDWMRLPDDRRAIPLEPIAGVKQSDE